MSNTKDDQINQASRGVTSGRIFQCGNLRILRHDDGDVAVEHYFNDGAGLQWIEIEYLEPHEAAGILGLFALTEGKR